MSEYVNNEDLEELVNSINQIDETPEVEVSLFQNMQVESPFTKSEEKNYGYSNKVETPSEEYTVIGSSTTIDSNITCGGNIKVKGQVRGTVRVSGSAVIFGVVEGTIEANDVTLMPGARVNGNISCKTDLNAEASSTVTGNVLAKNAYVSSSITGNVETSVDLKLASTATVIGDIVAGNMSVASGAVINGNVAIRRK